MIGCCAGDPLTEIAGAPTIGAACRLAGQGNELPGFPYASQFAGFAKASESFQHVSGCYLLSINLIEPISRPSARSAGSAWKRALPASQLCMLRSTICRAQLSPASICRSLHQLPCGTDQFGYLSSQCDSVSRVEVVLECVFIPLRCAEGRISADR